MCWLQASFTISRLRLQKSDGWLAFNISVTIHRPATFSFFPSRLSIVPPRPRAKNPWWVSMPRYQILYPNSPTSTHLQHSITWSYTIYSAGSLKTSILSTRRLESRISLTTALPTRRFKASLTTAVGSWINRLKARNASGVWMSISGCFRFILRGRCMILWRGRLPRGWRSFDRGCKNEWWARMDIRALDVTETVFLKGNSVSNT